jgi:predicted dehydrogenase
MPPHQVLIVGVGSIGERHLRCFAQTKRAELSFCEINAPLRETIAGRYGVQKTFADFDEAVASRPDIAVICAPAHLHIPMAQKLASAGIHTLCEKPLSVSLDGIAELSETVERQGVVLGIAYTWRHFPISVALKESLQSGRFGRPLNLVHVSGQNFPTYRPAYREIYYNDHKTGGGAIQDAMTHMINLGEWLVGPVDGLVADAAHLSLPDVEVEDTVHVLTRQGDVLGSYALNQHQSAKTTMFTIACEKATVVAEYHNNRWMWQEAPEEDWHVEQFPAVERDSNYVSQASSFLDAVEGLSEVRCTLGEGLQTLRVNLAALASLEQRAWQQIA